MDILTILIFISVTIISGSVLFLKKRYSYWKSRGIPYEEPNFPYGNFKGVFKTISLADILDRMYKSCKLERAPLIGVYFSINPLIVITDLDLIKAVLIKDFNYFADRGMFVNEKDDPLSANLFMLDGQQWRFIRNKVSPTFTSGKMKLMFETFVNVGIEFTKTIEEMIKTQDVFEIKDLMQRYTTDVIGSCAFGINCNSLKDPNTEFRVMSKKVFTERRNGEIIDGFKFAFPNLARKLGLKNFTDDVIEFFLKIIRETVEYREKHNVTRNDFMNILMKLKKTSSDDEGLTIEQITAQAFVFFLAGFESSSIAMSFCLYELALNSEIQDKLRAEINRVLDKHNGELSYDAIKEMKYLEQVINESLRKYPPSPNLMRTCVKDYEVPGKNLTIEKGTPILVSIYSIHNDPEIYEEPEKFDPERFSSEKSASRHALAFLPFGDGPRNCVGFKFGLMQIRVGLVFLIKNFYFEDTPSNQVPLEFDVKGPLLKPKHGIHLKMKKVKQFYLHSFDSMCESLE